MIAVLIIYAAAVSALLFGAAVALEFFVRAIGAPTRFVWAAAMTASACLSFAVIQRSTSRPASAPVHRDRLVRDHGAIPLLVVRRSMGRWAFAAAAKPENRWLALERSATAQLERTAGAEAQRLTRFDIPLVALWALGSLLCFMRFAIGAVRVRRARRSLGHSVVANEHVLVSRDLGPALLGAVRSRIVVPEWVLALPADEQRLIVAHEKSHRDALDPALALLATILAALQPWNAALWAALSRLRLAIEADCDRRVVPDDIDGREAHRYGELLLCVYQRCVNGVAPTLAFVERRSSLETRILRLTRSRPRAASFASVAAMGFAVLAVATACAIPRPALRVETTAPTYRISALRPEWQASIGGSTSATHPAPMVNEVSSRALSVPNMPPVAAISLDAHDESPMHVRATSITPIVSGIRQHQLCRSESRGQELCSADGDIVVRAVDDRHVIVGVLEGDGRSINDPVDHLFLITAYQPIAGLQSRVFFASHFEYSRGMLRIFNPRGQPKLFVFAVGGDTIDDSSDTPPASGFRNLSISQYVGHPLTLAMIPLLTRAPSCEPADHVCYAIDRITIGFP
jgi:beta-lactamase regulating signal transducer with metallopeptidase domain